MAMAMACATASAGPCRRRPAVSPHSPASDSGLRSGGRAPHRSLRGIQCSPRTACAIAGRPVPTAHRAMRPPAPARRRHTVAPSPAYVIVVRPAEMLGEHQVSRLSVKPGAADFDFSGSRPRVRGPRPCILAPCAPEFPRSAPLCARRWDRPFACVANTLCAKRIPLRVKQFQLYLPGGVESLADQNPTTARGAAGYMRFILEFWQISTSLCSPFSVEKYD
ncbi:hypothetical protein GSI_00027 [Ganoderma sinense ZZ0214-1]|uniref:Uncharacterized protein n=1 Tax=Ganoderma sinense ZZ0214-1 TaxID=1077348 RepID=A0A2G8SRE5_9APHY|nr:hypothetical protein GSI_00027 [Ganoderma sinense ZZ0214-1]